MLIILKDKNTIIKQIINKYYQYKKITIYYDDGYYISLKDGYFFDDGTTLKKLTLQKYTINRDNDYDPIIIYVYDNSKGLNDFFLYENSNFYLSRNINSDIICNDNYLNDYHLELFNKRIDTNFDELIVNHRKYKNEILKNGDYIELLGFSFYYYDDFLYINNFNVEIKLKRKEINEKIINYYPKKVEIKNYYVEAKKGIKLDKIDSFNVPKRNNSRKLILQLGPTVTMSLAMIMLACINIYNNLQNSSKISIIALLLMPITMLISGILWPTITSISEKGSYKKEYNYEKDNYLKYLKEYDEDLDIKISEYIKEENRDFFNIKDIKEKVFYISKKSKDFLDITIGYQKLNLDLDIKLTKDKDIDEYLNRIKYRINNIENCPLYLNLKDKHKVTIIVKETRKEYFLKRYLLELIYKYHYEDIYVGIYTKDITLLNDINNIPHLFFNQIRLTLINERQLQDINNYKFDKPLILLMFDYSGYIFSNKNIHVLYFSSSPAVILKNSDCVIEFNNNTGLLNDEIKKEFKYYEQEINFKKYFDYISCFNNKNINQIILSFKDINPNINIVNNYLSFNNTLQADFATINDELLSFDLHESKDGPHGLIGGSTGSGKSELIISLLLSLVMNYSPEYLNIILIDYKGGGIKESLSYNGQTIPHIIAAINNLETDTFERLVVAIDRECKRRQELFKKLSNLSSTSIMNIDEYLGTNKEYCFENIAHLLIVVDEFAELKKENPYIIKELISFSRIGRSLGIHLILATQRPSGVIDDEIWSNSHFKIALKVHSEKDSQDIIKSKEAAYLGSPGEFYLQVDDNTIKAKAIYSKRDINNNDQFEVDLLDNRLVTVNRKIYKRDNPYQESTYLSKLIIDACTKLNINIDKFEYEKPLSLSRKELINKYNNNNNLIFGEIDDYLDAKKGILEYSLNNNIIVYSNRKNEINNILNILKENNIQTIVISNNKYKTEVISDSLLYQDDEDIRYLFNKIINDNDSKINIVIEDLSTLLSYSDDYLNMIYQLVRRSTIFNFSLTILTKESNLNYKLLNSIKDKIAINVYDQQDIINLYSTKGVYQGKSYYFDDSPITFIPCLIEELISGASRFKPYVDQIPRNINYEYINNKLLIGYEILNRKPLYLKDNEYLLITSFDNDLLDKYKLIYHNNLNVKICLYNDDLFKNNFSNILWFSDGLYAQHLFYVEHDIKLENGDAYLYRNNKGRLIRPVNYE